MSSHNKISDAELAYKVARKVMGWDPCNDPMHWVEVLDEMERRGYHTAIMTGIKDDPDLDGYLAECGTYANLLVHEAELFVLLHYQPLMKT